MSLPTYGSRLQAAVVQHGPLCVGIDPHPGILQAWGLPVDVTGLERCARTMVQAATGQVAQVKPQSAFFEAHGSAGIAVLERVLADCRDAGLLSLLDVKRGDIGSTMDAYTTAYLTDGSPLAADAITLNPFLGVGSLDGALAQAQASGRGVYLLAATSNPEAGGLQRARTEVGTPVAQSVIEAAGAANAGAAQVGPDVAGSSAGATGTGPTWGSVGVVVGITIPAETADLLDFSGLGGPVLAPGVGAQGGTADDVSRVFGPAAPLVIPTSSRAVMAAGPRVEALTDTIRRAGAEISATLTR